MILIGGKLTGMESGPKLWQVKKGVQFHNTWETLTLVTLYRTHPQSVFATTSNGLTKAKERAGPQRTTRSRKEQPCQEKVFLSYFFAMCKEEQ